MCLFMALVSCTDFLDEKPNAPRWSRQDGGNGLQHMRQLLKSVYGNRAALYTHTTDGYFYLYLHIDDLNPYDHGK